MRTLTIYKLGDPTQGMIPSYEETETFAKKLSDLIGEERDKVALENGAEIEKIIIPEDKEHLVLFRLGDERLGWVPGLEDADAFCTLLKHWQQDRDSCIIFHYGISSETIKIPKGSFSLITGPGEVRVVKDIDKGEVNG